MISLAPISVEEMMAPWSQQRGVWTGTGRLICLTWVWFTQLQAVSGEGKYSWWIRNEASNVRVQTKVRLMLKVGSLRIKTLHKARTLPEHRASWRTEDWGSVVTKWRGHKERVPLHYSSSNPSLTNTSVAAVRTSGFRLSVFRFLVSPPFPHPQCITHPVYHLQLRRENGRTYSGGVSKQIDKHLLLFSYF